MKLALVLAILASPVAADAPRYSIAAIFCEGEACEPVRIVVSPRGSETTVDWCGRYAFGRAVTLAHNFIPRAPLTVQPGSVFCEEV